MENFLSLLLLIQSVTTCWFCTHSVLAILYYWPLRFKNCASWPLCQNSVNLWIENQVLKILTLPMSWGTDLDLAAATMYLWCVQHQRHLRRFAGLLYAPHSALQTLIYHEVLFMVVCFREKWKNIPWGLGQLEIDIYGINFALLICKV